jgi:hypothetical protein
MHEHKGIDLVLAKYVRHFGGVFPSWLWAAR